MALAGEKLFYHGGPANPDRSRPLVVKVFGYTQGLYGPEQAKRVDSNCRTIAQYLDTIMPFKVEYIGTTKNAEDSARIVNEAQDPNCLAIAGIPHTFSPGGLHPSFKRLGVPYFHLVTTMDRNISDRVDRGYMDLNQSAHAHKEVARALTQRGVYFLGIYGHWQDPGFAEKLDRYGRVAAAKKVLQDGKIWCMGDKMEDVYGTEVDRNTFQDKFGPRIVPGSTQQLFDLMQAISPRSVDELVAELIGRFDTAADLKAGGEFHHDLQYAVRQYLAVQQMLKSDKFIGWTAHFDRLKPLTQLPALAAQLTMRDGYGYGPEGDIMTSAHGAAFKIIGLGRPGASSMTEPYIMDWKELGVTPPTDLKELIAHMAETSLDMAAEGPVRLRRDPLEIGPSDPMAKLLFKMQTGLAILSSLSVIPGGLQLITTEGKIASTPDLPNLTTAAGIFEYSAGKAAAEAADMLMEPHHPQIAVNGAVTTQDVDALARMSNLPHTVINKEILDGKGEIRQEFRERAERLTGIAQNRHN